VQCVNNYIIIKYIRRNLCDTIIAAVRRCTVSRRFHDQHYGPGNDANDPEERVKQLKDSLGLNDKQTEQIVNIFKDMSAKRQALMDSVSDRDARREAMMGMMKSTDDKIEALLTPDQKDKYEAMKKAREAMMRQRMN